MRDELAKRVAQILKLRKIRLEAQIIEDNIYLTEQLSKVERHLELIKKETGYKSSEGWKQAKLRKLRTCH